MLLQRWQGTRKEHGNYSCIDRETHPILLLFRQGTRKIPASAGKHIRYSCSFVRKHGKYSFTGRENNSDTPALSSGNTEVTPAWAGKHARYSCSLIRTHGNYSYLGRETRSIFLLFRREIRKLLPHWQGQSAMLLRGQGMHIYSCIGRGARYTPALAGMTWVLPFIPLLAGNVY